jgi:predicted secreted protein
MITCDWSSDVCSSDLRDQWRQQMGELTARENWLRLFNS